MYMASGSIRDSSTDDLNSNSREGNNNNTGGTENIKVYTRRKNNNKKASKTSDNNDTATTATTTADYSVSVSTAAASSDNPTTAPTPAEVPSAPTPSAATAEAPSSTSKEPDVFAAASTPPTSPPPATAAQGNGAVVQESSDTLTAVKDADSNQLREQSPHKEKSPSQKSVDKDVEEQEQHQHIPSLPEDQGGANENAGLQNHEDLPLDCNGEAQNLKEKSPLEKSPNHKPQTSGDGIQNLRESSPLPRENDLPNEGEVAVAPVPSGNGVANANGVVKPPLLITRVDDRVRFKLYKATPKNEIRELRKKLKYELDQVRRLAEQFEAKEHQLASYKTQISNYSNISNNANYMGTQGIDNIGGYSHPHSHYPDARPDMVDRRVFLRVNSDMGAARNLEPRPYSRQLSVAVSNHMSGEYVEKEKRTPKANQLYRNSEFLLGKDRLPSESNKRLKKNNGRKHNSGVGDGFGGFRFDKTRTFKSCDSLLRRLMKHKFGWVFNEPVDAQQLGLVDYHDIIKHPMDLGTVKRRLTQNWYKSPREFAEDVRLVFSNAMTYNLKGQDVHAMAEELLLIFEDRWAVIEAENNQYQTYQMYPDSSGMVTPTSRKAPPPIHGMVAPMTTPVAVDPKFQRPYVGRTPAQKKPKAKDPNKRDMTYDEKQKLSTQLQSLPPEKLDAICQIIKRRGSALSQNGDEIEVDIDNVDTETLWELDRFVTNYKKSLSKYKRRAELALQARSLARQTPAVTNTTPAVAEPQMESGTVLEKSNAPPAVEGEKQGGSRSSSSSSSSDSGSSSSDSDSDSSSEDGSDAGHSPGT